MNNLEEDDSSSIGDENLFEVEKILAMKEEFGMRRYLIKWKHYDDRYIYFFILRLVFFPLLFSFPTLNFFNFFFSFILVKIVGNLKIILVVLNY
ncbi:hypothetical protein BDA99DRAFT_169034 [Phascolomyces articulosus]|uniref:Chromo domain-containing protein n=1 Tax=Phascolomyces articulosus TaxID=60185 RepID=A0AAD5JTY5_9FUNG|nr:hypothetical protein BDA99DRAFT_169034 [Phascolomyces articulosus]